MMNYKKTIVAPFATMIVSVLFLSLLYGCEGVSSNTLQVTGSTTPTDNNTNNNIVIDPNADNDNDGLKNSEEALYGTDINKADTDDDQLSDFDEITTHHTDSLSADSDQDGRGDYQEVLVDHTDPLNPDHDLDGYAPVANISGWPAEADCNDGNAAIHPGANDVAGNFVDMDCKPDVTTFHHQFLKGYIIDATLNIDAQGTYGVYIKTTKSANGEYHGETHVDTTIPNIPDNQTGADGCRLSSGCKAPDYDNQPFTADHKSSSWVFCAGYQLDIGNGFYEIYTWDPNCNLPSVTIHPIIGGTEGVGFKVDKLANNSFRVSAVGREGNSPVKWKTATAILGE